VAELRLTGRPASPGLALSRLFVLAETAHVAVVGPADDHDGEAERLRTAIVRAIKELEEVAGQAEEDARDILEFQIAMLGDDALSEAAFSAIAGGGERRCRVAGRARCAGRRLRERRGRILPRAQRRPR
jgi:phosphotransferase system enzyme I (PtsI)